MSEKNPGYYLGLFYFTEDEIEYFLNIKSSGVTLRDQLDQINPSKYNISFLFCKVFNIRRGYDNHKNFLYFMNTYSKYIYTPFINIDIGMLGLSNNIYHKNYQIYLLQYDLYIIKSKEEYEKYVTLAKKSKSYEENQIIFENYKQNIDTLKNDVNIIVS